MLISRTISLCVALSFLCRSPLPVLCLMNSSPFGLSEFRTQRDLWAPFSFSSLQPASYGSGKVLPLGSSSQGSLSCTTCCPMSENHCFIYFAWCYICFRKEGIAMIPKSVIPDFSNLKKKISMGFKHLVSSVQRR